MTHSVAYVECKDTKINSQNNYLQGKYFCIYILFGVDCYIVCLSYIYPIFIIYLSYIYHIFIIYLSYIYIML